MVELVFPEETVVFFLWCFAVWLGCFCNKLVAVVLGMLFIPVFSLLLFNYHGWLSFDASIVFVGFCSGLSFYAFWRIVELRS